MNFREIVAKLKLESGRQGPAPASPESSSKDDLRLWGWVADEWNSLQTDGTDWKFMRATASFATVAGKATYTQGEIGTSFTKFWPSDIDGYRGTVTNGAVVSLLNPERDYDALRRASLSGGTQGVPTDYALTPSMGMMLLPTPDRVVTVSVDVVRAPTVLARYDDEPTGLPAHHQNILVWGALKRLAVDDAAGELLQRANSEYDAAWSRLWDEQGPVITVEQARW